MSKVIVVGDLHGRHEVVELALNYDCDKVVFVGDYVDSRHRSIGDQLQCFDRVYEAIDAGRAIGLLGNHDVGYMNTSWYGIHGGFNGALLSSLQARHHLFKAFQYFVWIEGFLITHAGVSQLLLDYVGMSLDQYLDVGDYRQVGRARGGRDPVGGLLWCHYDTEFEPIEGVKQIFGHTANEKIRSHDGNWCIDALQDPRLPVLLIEDGEGQIVYLND